MSDDILRVAALTIACFFGLWTAVACRRAQRHGVPGSDALVWAGLSVALFLLSLTKTARGLGLLARRSNRHNQQLAAAECMIAPIISSPLF